MATPMAICNEIDDLIQRELALQAAEKAAAKAAAKPKGSPSETAIAAFNRCDYDRLVAKGTTDVLKIEDITDEKMSKIALLLQALIRQGKLSIMDKESGWARMASVVIGFNKGGLLIAHER